MVPCIESTRKVLARSPTIDLNGRTIPYFEFLLAEGLIKTMAPPPSQILRVGDR